MMYHHKTWLLASFIIFDIGPIYLWCADYVIDCLADWNGYDAENRMWKESLFLKLSQKILRMKDPGRAVSNYKLKILGLIAFQKAWFSSSCRKCSPDRYTNDDFS